MLVLGGTGHIGSAIARRFAEVGHRVTAAGQSAEPRPNLDGASVTRVRGNDHDPEIIGRWVAGQDLVIDAATPYPLWLHDLNRNETVAQARHRVRQVLAEARDAQAAILHISSFTTLPHTRSVLGQIRQGMIEGLHSYFELKKAVEDEVLGALAQGLKGAVLNPATCFGPYDLKPKSQTFAPMLLSGAVKGIVSAPLNVVDVRDVAEVALAAQQHGYPDRQIPVFGYNIDLPALAARLCALRDRPPPVLRVPPTLGLAALYWSETAFAATGRQTPWPSLPMMLLDASYAAQPSAAQIRLRPQLRPLDETLEDAITWYESIDYIP